MNESESAIDCPRCGTPLERETYERIYVDRCPGCQGTWLDRGEFGAVLHSDEDKFGWWRRRKIKKKMKKQLAFEREGFLDCPYCGKEMVKRKPIDPLVIDLCRDHGVWLDPLELEASQVMAQESREAFYKLLRSIKPKV